MLPPRYHPKTHYELYPVFNAFPNLLQTLSNFYSTEFVPWLRLQREERGAVLISRTDDE